METVHETIAIGNNCKYILKKIILGIEFKVMCNVIHEKLHGNHWIIFVIAIYSDYSEETKSNEKSNVYSIL